METKINVAPNEAQNSIDEDKELIVNNNNHDDFSLTTKYHVSEIEQNRIIILNAIGMIWVGIILIIYATMNAVEKESAITFVTVVSGALIDLFSVGIINLVNKSSDTKQKYFENLSVMDHEREIMKFTENADNDFKRKMVEKLVEKHCKDT